VNAKKGELDCGGEKEQRVSSILIWQKRKSKRRERVK